MKKQHPPVMKMFLLWINKSCVTLLSLCHNKTGYIALLWLITWLLMIKFTQQIACDIVLVTQVLLMSLWSGHVILTNLPMSTCVKVTIINLDSKFWFWRCVHYVITSSSGNEVITIWQLDQSLWSSYLH